MFLSINIGLLNSLGLLFTEYDDIQKRWDYFYNLPKNSLDILILGNSHAYSSYSPNVIDAICETNSFVLASNSQKLEQTYFNLKEALKYQSPDLVIIQASVITGDSWRTAKGDYRVYSNLDGMKFSLNKIKSIFSIRPLNDYINSIFPLIQNHKNWKNKELIQDNLERKESELLEDFRGFDPRASEMGDKVMEQYNNADKFDYTKYEMSDSDKLYLNKIRELSLKREFKVLYVMSPKYSDIINPTYSSKSDILLKSISNIGDGYLDFNLLTKEIGFNQRSFENGFISYQHTSHYGAVQLSTYLAKEIIRKALVQPRGSKDNSWKTRMATIPEYLVFNDDKIENETAYSSNSDFALFDSVIIDNLDILRKKNGSYAFIIRFKENLDTNKLKDFKFYFHLYPSESDSNIKEDRKQYGFENYDFNPLPLPDGKGGFYISREIETKIIDVELINIGLFKSGSKDRSKKMSIEKINLLEEQKPM